ncbi:MAG: hypothetical protein A4E55_02057 [Pelotomaculum sp. PtaU1.Bin035]|nr:MAG: hypothetical protein A4E55_02057 [Pelotomaculum sp. PtaU1.Bin035]
MRDKMPQSETVIKILTKDDLDKFSDMELDLLLHEDEYKKEEPHEDNEQENMPPVEPDQPLYEDELKKEAPRVDNGQENMPPVELDQPLHGDETKNETPCVDDTQEIIPPIPPSPPNNLVKKTRPKKTNDNKLLTKAEVTVNFISVSVIQHQQESLKKA